MTSLSTSGVPKVVWMLWLKGWEDAPGVVRASRASWSNRNPGWKVWPLDRDSLDRFIPPDRLDRMLSTDAPREALSDLIRLELLHRYGGVWADATTICAKPLDSWLDPCARQGFFAFDRPRPDRMISSWFLAAHRGSYIVEHWREAAARYWHERKQRDDYFWIHQLFEETYASDAHFKSLWDSVPKRSAAHPFHFGPDAPALLDPPSPMHREGLRSPPVAVFKLTHKLGKPAGDHSLMAAICAFSGCGHGGETPLPSRRVLVAWYGSFGHGTIGDLRSMQSLVGHLHALGHQVSHATDLDVDLPGCERVDWRTVDPASFDSVVFACGPVIKSHAESAKFFSRFSASRLAGVGVSLFPRGSCHHFNPFQVVFARQGGGKDFGDIAIVAPLPLDTGTSEHRNGPRIGIVLRGEQAEYGAEQCRSTETENLLVQAARQAIGDGRGDIIFIENHLVRSALSPDAIERQYAGCDLILTSRFHGGIGALRAGVPFMAIDQIEGGAKVAELLSRLDWPHVYTVEEVGFEEMARLACSLLEDPAKGRLLAARDKAVGMANETLESMSEWIAGHA